MNSKNKLHIINKKKHINMKKGIRSTTNCINIKDGKFFFIV